MESDSFINNFSTYFRINLLDSQLKVDDLRPLETLRLSDLREHNTQRDRKEVVRGVGLGVK